MNKSTVSIHVRFSFKHSINFLNFNTIDSKYINNQEMSFIDQMHWLLGFSLECNVFTDVSSLEKSIAFICAMFLVMVCLFKKRLSK